MQISPPFGYKEVVPFLKTQKVRLLAPGEVPDFVQHGNAIPISLSEFQPVAHDYPIVFTATEGTQSFAPVAVLGLTSGENLFHQGASWASGVYIPAYARRYPFCMARVNVNQVEQKDRLIELLSGLSQLGGVRVTIGEENPVPDLQDCTLITSTYTYRDQVLGILGIVGPRRMPYPQVISIVGDAAHQVSERLSRVRRHLYIPS